MEEHFALFIKMKSYMIGLGAGLDFEFKKQYPSIIAVYAGIEYGIKNNFKIYDFMGAGNPNQEYGGAKI